MTFIHCLVWFECLNTVILGSLNKTRTKKKKKTESDSEPWESYITLWHKTIFRTALILSCIYIYASFASIFDYHRSLARFVLCFPPAPSVLLSAPSSVLQCKSCVKVNSTQWPSLHTQTELELCELQHLNSLQITQCTDHTQHRSKYRTFLFRYALQPLVRASKWGGWNNVPEHLMERLCFVQSWESSTLLPN